jgi:hypothetical protein
MALEPALDTLQRTLGRLQECVSDLQVTLAEDWPDPDAPKLVDDWETLVTDLASLLDEAVGAAGQAHRFVQSSQSLDEAARSLQRVHELLNRFTARYIDELANHDHLARLLAMGNERGLGWREWCHVVKAAIGGCALPLHHVSSAALACWSEFADRIARQSVSVQATNIGQQITVRENELEATRRAG